MFRRHGRGVALLATVRGRGREAGVYGVGGRELASVWIVGLIDGRMF